LVFIWFGVNSILTKIPFLFNSNVPLRAVLDHFMPLDEAEIANLYAQTCHLTRLVNDLGELSLTEIGPDTLGDGCL
jgi:hypothetical protein